ncbi:uncharacterized protein K452DRAFT_324417 [Aplosporella prunicola CBS 121167]|uniref:t-SNARE coiled-coil homology domain-containing protein n=1 Tax=Aplosporella prunicola CBS 121167 TaxID=1176127 RepID=A0A6A6BMQ6_9PEZI|nr:uncharacterized protein K452DRAFT_324417 [Aplosporella prunicola CBS 121167]KAF2145412.1 hypothetical protein K452DRAFT_324417 [Aplosporella prunicola CBS 121167]
MSANPAQLFLLADHIKLSLLERQRAVSLNLSPNSQDGQISRSLESLHSGIEAIEAQLDQDPNDSLSDQLPRLRAQYSDLSNQFSAPANNAAPPHASISAPNDPSLAADFSAAQSRSTGPKKAVRFTDNPAAAADDDVDALDAANRAALFPYRDDPDADGANDQSALTNEQIHAYHRSVLREQDDQLDRLGESIGRQRELSMAIGDELDGHVLMLDEVDEGVDRHQSQLDRAGKRLAKVGRRARENWSMTIIVVLIVILVLLIVITK